MIISRTPFRVSFFGGGTDYPAWFRKNGGAVISTSIDKYCYISCRRLPPFFDHKFRVAYSRIEHVKDISQIEHPSVRAVLSEMNVEEGLEIHHDADLPARSGLGSSSAFTVGLINAIRALDGKISSKKELAQKAIYIEQQVIQESVGCQDQIAVACGGFNKIKFNQQGDFYITPVIINHDKLELLQNHLMLFFTGFSRYSSRIAQATISNIDKREEQLQLMGQMVDEAEQILQSQADNVSDFGKLLHQAWLQKKQLSNNVSSPQIDEIYNAGLEAGAIGGKLLGAGGGGFILLFAPPEKQRAIKEKLSNLIYVNFRFETEGSKIVLYDPKY